MSQSGQKPAASPRPRRAAARRTQEHVNEKTSGSPSRPGGEKKGADENKAASLASSQPRSRLYTRGAVSTSKMSASSIATSKPSSMNPTEAKDVKTEPEKKSQSTKPSVVHEKKLQEEKPKEHKEPRSLPKPASDTGDKHVHSEKSKEPKTKSKNTGDSAQSLVAGVTVTSDKPKDKSDIDAALDDLVDTLGKPEETKEDDTKYTGPEVSDPMDSTYIEELGKREVTIPPKYWQLLNKKDGATQPSSESVNTMSEEVIDALSASLGTRKPEPELDLSSLKEVSEAKAREEKLKTCGEDDETIPPEFRLKPDKDGKLPLPELGEKPKLLSESELIDELSEDFDQSKSKEKPSKQTEKVKGSEAPAPSPMEDTVSQASMCRIQSAPPTSAPPTSATSKDVIPDDAVDRLAGSLGKREADPEDGKPMVDKVKEKAKEEEREKLGEKEETIPPDYRLEETKDKDGKPLLPKEPKKELAPMSDDLLLDALSKDFSGPQNTSNLGPKTPAPSPGGETVSKTSMCSIQSAPPKSVPPKSAPPTPEPPKSAPPKPATSKGVVPDDAVDLLAGSLGKREADPEDGKPVVDKVKEKAKAEDREKLGEKEETIPPDYRLEETKDKDGKPLLPKESKQDPQPMSDDLLLDALSDDFSGPPNMSNLEKKFDDAKLAAVISDVVLETAASATQSAHPPPKAPQSDNKALDDALDQLSDSLGQRQPDPDENKPMEDKVKERAKAEHRDKLGERDDTIPPEYRHLLDNDDPGKSGKPSAKKPKESTKPASGQDPIDALSEDFNNCPSTTETPQKATKSKGKKTDSSGKTHKNGGKSKESSKAKEGASKSKGVEKNSS